MGREAESSIRKKVLAAATFIKLARAWESVSTRIHGDLASMGLMFSQFAILEVLYNKGRLRVDEVRAKVLGGSSSSLTAELAGLEERGLVERSGGSGDDGTSLLGLTPQGHDLLQDFLPKHLDKIEAEMDVLSDEELTVLGDLLRKLGRGRGPANREWRP